MSDLAGPLEAKRLREAFKQVGARPESGEKELKCEYVEIRSRFDAGPKDLFDLCLIQDQELIASVKVSQGTLKRLMREVQWFKNVRTGCVSRANTI